MAVVIDDCLVLLRCLTKLIQPFTALTLKNVPPNHVIAKKHASIASKLREGHR
jgi:hypothetical protein